MFNPCSHSAPVEPYQQMGIDRLVFRLPTEGRNAKLRALDSLAAVAERGA